tara:strand:- start:499 stop:696 length:198 start_codon:yes stop_codon:yes gene_type:complete
MELFLNTTDLNNPKIEITMSLQQLFQEAQNRYQNGYSESRLVDYVFLNAKNRTQATKILNKILNK